MCNSKKIYLLRFLSVFLILLCLLEFLKFVNFADSQIKLEIYDNLKFFSKENMWQILKILHPFVLIFAELTGANICLKLCKKTNETDNNENNSISRLKSAFDFLLVYWMMLIVAFLVFMCIEKIPEMFKIDFSIIFIFLFIFGIYKIIDYRFLKHPKRRY